MSNENNTVGTPEDDYDVLLPEGWSGDENADFFDLSTWGSSGTTADAQEDGESEEEGNSEEETDGQTRTTEEDTDSQTEPSEDDEDPTTVIVDDENNLLKFRANIDHVTQSVELDPADLPIIYQKSVALDRYQNRVRELEAELAEWDKLATGLKYENRAALQESIFEGAVQDYLHEHPAVEEGMARDYLSRQFGKDPKPAEQETVPPDSRRDFTKEVAELFTAFPMARVEGVPEEVSKAAIAQDKPLVQAYAEWRAKAASAEANRAKRENKILKQNQAAAAKAPVSKVTGGGKTDTSPVDDFLRGFNDDAW